MTFDGLQKMTLLDFPGKIACTVFTHGCNFRCPFCHSPGLVVEEETAAYTEEDILSFLKTRQGLLDGVCITGGEPTLHKDLPDFIKKVRALGFAVKLDTNGALPGRLKPLLEEGLVDYVAMDIKSSPAGYAAATGTEVDTAVYDRSVRLLREGGVPYEFRTTAVGGIHTPEDFAAIGRWLGDVPRYFIQRFVDSGQLLGEGYAAFTDDEMRHLLTVVREYVPTAQLRGC
jgi:pyruvate formate lyase activating enzyme